MRKINEFKSARELKSIMAKVKEDTRYPAYLMHEDDLTEGTKSFSFCVILLDKDEYEFNPFGLCVANKLYKDNVIGFDYVVREITPELTERIKNELKRK
jgi:hypothetical protein